MIFAVNFKKNVVVSNENATLRSSMAPVSLLVSE